MSTATPEAREMPRLKKRYREEILPALRDRVPLRRTSCRFPA